MKSFAQQQNHLEEQKSSSLARWKPTIRRANDLANPLLDLQHTIGNRAVLRLLQAHGENFESALPSACSPAAEAIQTKLVINQPGDIYEEEADRISERVVNTSALQTQRGCASAGDLGGPTEQPGKQGERLQTKHIGPTNVSQTAAPPIVQEVLHSSGQPLDSAGRYYSQVIPGFWIKPAWFWREPMPAARKILKQVGGQTYLNSFDEPDEPDL